MRISKIVLTPNLFISLNATLVWRISLSAIIAGHIYSSKHIARVNKSTKLSRSIVKLLVQFVHPVKLNIKKAVWIRSFIWMLNNYVSPIQSSGKKCLHLRQPGPHHSLGASSFDVACCGPSILDVEHSLFQGKGTSHSFTAGPHHYSMYHGWPSPF